MDENTKGSRRIIWLNAIILVGTPIAAAILVPWYAWNYGIGLGPIIAGIAMWALCGLSITAGYHRLFSHRAYKAPWPIKLAVALFGGACWENSIIAWSAAHRFHHKHVDTDLDPYNAKNGFTWSHMGWILVEGPMHDRFDNVPDLWADPICRWQHENYLAISSTVTIGVPALVGYLIGDIWGTLLIAGLLRLVVVHHVTFSINSFAHMFGTRPWSEANTARDNWLLSLFTFGEGYHNYHHAFQGDYRNGPRWFNFDPSKWTIWGLSRIGLATDLKRTPQDVLLRKRFQDRAQAFRSWMDSLSERMSKRMERGASPSAMEWAAVRERAQAAQTRLEERLEELTVARKRLTLSMAQYKRERGEATRRELKELQRYLKSRVRAAKEALQEWEELVAETTRLAEPALA